MELRVPIQKDIERGEAAQNVFGQVGAVHPHHQTASPTSEELGLLGCHRLAGGELNESVGID